MNEQSETVISFVKLALDRKLISQEQLDLCASLVKKSKKIGLEATVEDVLVSKGFLTSEQVHELTEITVGEEMGLPTSAEIEAFLENGVEETMMLGTKVCRISGTTRFFPLLKGFDAERLQCQLSFSYLGRLAGSEAATRLPQYLSSLPRHPQPRTDERLHVDIPPPVPDDYTYRPSDVIGHQIIRRRPLDCWEELVTRTIRFGHRVNLRKGERLELLNTKVVIMEPTDDPTHVLDEYGFSLKESKLKEDAGRQNSGRDLLHLRSNTVSCRHDSLCYVVYWLVGLAPGRGDEDESAAEGVMYRYFVQLVICVTPRGTKRY